MSSAGRSKDQDLIDDLAAWMQAPDAEAAQTNGHARPRSPSSGTPADEMVIEKCRNKKDATEFSRLFDHADMSTQDNNASSADFALLRHLKFYTQDPDQLDRLMRLSALRRPKWDEGRVGRTWLRYSIDNALSEPGEAYDWGRQGSRPLLSSVSSLRDLGDDGNNEKQVAPAAFPYIGRAAKAAGTEAPKLGLVRFAGRPAPPTREFIVDGLIPRHHPTTLFGWGGTAKSLIAILLAMSVAGGREKFFGHDIAVHGPVMYIDFELDADEQHRRVMQLAAGMNMEVPEGLLYVSTLGARTHEAVDFALSTCEEHKAVLAVLDSLGPAMVGDMAAAKDVIGFHNCYIAPFKAAGATPLLVDHQARQQAGEGYQSKGAFGSAYKEHLSRSLIQVEAGDRSAEQGTLNVRLRHKKANFGALVDPFDVTLEFSSEEISASVRDLTPTDRAQEATLNSIDRVAAALEDGAAYPDELVETTGLSRSTVKNAITTLKRAERVETTGETKRQMEEVQLVAPAARPIKGKAAKATTPTVAGLFANPPSWLAGGLEKYRERPEAHFGPLCAAVEAAVLDEGGHVGRVVEEVRGELRKRGEEVPDLEKEA